MSVCFVVRHFHQVSHLEKKAIVILYFKAERILSGNVLIILCINTVTIDGIQGGNKDHISQHCLRSLSVDKDSVEPQESTASTVDHLLSKSKTKSHELNPTLFLFVL